MGAGRQDQDHHREERRLAVLPDRPYLCFAARVAAWKADLAELGTDTRHLPFLQALTKEGTLQLGHAHAKVRGLRLSGRTINTIVQTRAAAAEKAFIGGLPVRSHSLHVGADNDLKRACVSRARRNEERRWAPDSQLTDTPYSRADALANMQQEDVFEAVPLYGQWPAPDGPPPPGTDAAEEQTADRSYGELGRSGGHLLDPGGGCRTAAASPAGRAATTASTKPFDAVLHAAVLSWMSAVSGSFP